MDSIARLAFNNWLGRSRAAFFCSYPWVNLLGSIAVTRNCRLRVSRLCENTKSISQILTLANCGQQTCSESNCIRVFYLVSRSKFGGCEFSHIYGPTPVCKDDVLVILL